MEGDPGEDLDQAEEDSRSDQEDQEVDSDAVNLSLTALLLTFPLDSDFLLTTLALLKSRPGESVDRREGTHDIVYSS